MGHSSAASCDILAQKEKIRFDPFPIFVSDGPAFNPMVPLATPTGKWSPVGSGLIVSNPRPVNDQKLFGRRDIVVTNAGSPPFPIETSPWLGPTPWGTTITSRLSRRDRNPSLSPPHHQCRVWRSTHTPWEISDGFSFASALAYSFPVDPCSCVLTVQPTCSRSRTFERNVTDLHDCQISVRSRPRRAQAFA